MVFKFRWIACLAVLLTWIAVADASGADSDVPRFRLATFSADVTIPLGHRCMGVLPTKSQQILDPLDVHGFVLLGGDQPVVLAAFDWCEIRNDAYDQWRAALAAAAGTTRERVLVTSLHQHDAPVIDRRAQQYLDGVELPGELYDTMFHDQCLARVTAALREALRNPQPLTHIGVGTARVEKVASNRRVVSADGRVSFSRGSSSAGNPALAAAPDDLIDPDLKTITFFNNETPLLELHAYATHPMSYYGRGGVSADFVGLARRQRLRDNPRVAQIYVSGCSGDVTAGKYNDGSPAMRPLLADRLYQAMRQAAKKTTKHPLRAVAFRNTQIELPFNDSAPFGRAAMTRTLNNPQAPTGDRILAAMGLASRDRIDAGRKIDLPCVDFGPAQVVLFPGEAFVGYQLLAAGLRPDSFVMSIGYGECWPGYIPTQAAFKDNFGHSWRWVAPGCEARITPALKKILQVGE